MKKITLIITLLLGVILIAAPVSFAQVNATKTFTVSATIPGATGISINAYNVTGNNNPVLVSGLNLSFDPLTYDPVNYIYMPDHYFYIDVQATGGPGTPTTTLTFAQGSNPNAANSGNGLGWKGALTYAKVDSLGVVNLLPTHPKELFKDVNGDVVLPAELGAGSFFRAYLGLNVDSTMPAGGEMFTLNDAAGVYDGTLLVTATIP